jgi:hypothetical protein
MNYPDAEFPDGCSMHDIPGRLRMFVFHKPLTTFKTWRSWEIELWKLLRSDPPERRLWATVLALALADVYRGRRELAQAAWNWMVAQPRLREGKAAAPMFTRLGAYEWVCNELELPHRSMRQDVWRDIHAKRTRARIDVP